MTLSSPGGPTAEPHYRRAIRPRESLPAQRFRTRPSPDRVPRCQPRRSLDGNGRSGSPCGQSRPASRRDNPRFNWCGTSFLRQVCPGRRSRSSQPPHPFPSAPGLRARRGSVPSRHQGQRRHHHWNETPDGGQKKLFHVLVHDQTRPQSGKST